MRSTQIKDLTWVEFKEAVKETDVLIVPIGSLEEHGLHNPLGTDTSIANACAALTGKLANALVAPAVPYGYNHNTKSFPGSVSLSVPLLRKILVSYVEGYIRHGIKKVLFINGHDENSLLLPLVASDIYDKYNIICTFTQWWAVLPKINKEWACDEKGGYFETCMMLAADEQSVDMSKCKVSEKIELNDEIAYDKDWKFKEAAVYFPVDLYKLGKEGTAGKSAEGANKEIGEKMMKAYAEFNAGLIKEMREL